MAGMSDSNREYPREWAPDLQALDRELQSVEFEERPSFGPELRAELEGLAGEQSQSRRRLPRMARMAAALVLVAGTVSVPSLRASAFEMWTRLQGESPPPERVVPVPTTFEFLDRAAEDPVFVPLPVGLDLREEAEEEVIEAPWSGDLPAATPIDAYPVLLDRDGVDHLVRLFYPDRIENQGIGGVVRLIVWVEDDGSVADRQVLASSGVAELDEAALRAAQHFRFKPARRRGAPVGTWVEFNIDVQGDRAAPTR